jgi:uncharacterized protein (DUF2336 family)
MNLSQIDVEKLAHGASARARIDVADKIAEAFSQGRLGGREKDIAVDILRLLAKDAETRVRVQLTQHLQSCSELPRDLALQLAQDVEQVSVPLLQYTEVLDEEDFIAIIAASEEIAKLEAIARRQYVSDSMSDALLQKDHEKLTRTLLGNKGAVINERSLLHTIERMADNSSVIEMMMERGGLPVSCVEKIFLTVSRGMKEKLAKRYQVSRHLVEGKIEYAREMSTLGVTALGDGVKVEALVKQMHRQHRLTSSVIIRALCMGDLRFFECAMAELTHVPVENIAQLMRDAGPNGFQSLYRLSPLPPAYYAAVKKLLDLVLEATHNGRKRPADFSQRIVDAISENGYDLSIEYMPLLLEIIKGNSSEFSRIH